MEAIIKIRNKERTILEINMVNLATGTSILVLWQMHQTFMAAIAMSGKEEREEGAIY